MECTMPGSELVVWVEQPSLSVFQLLRGIRCDCGKGGGWGGGGGGGMQWCNGEGRDGCRTLIVDVAGSLKMVLSRDLAPVCLVLN